MTASMRLADGGQYPAATCMGFRASVRPAGTRQAAGAPAPARARRRRRGIAAAAAATLALAACLAAPVPAQAGPLEDLGQALSSIFGAGGGVFRN